MCSTNLIVAACPAVDDMKVARLSRRKRKRNGPMAVQSEGQMPEIAVPDTSPISTPLSEIQLQLV